MIQFNEVCFSYANQGPTIHNVSFRVPKGGFVSIIGENGAGKSTVTKLINGILKPSSGTVTVAGMDTSTTKTSKIASKVGFLFQNPDRQICCKTVREEICFGLRLVSGKSESEILTRAEEMIARYELNGDMEPFTLSRGERQKLALASIIAISPEILILDEPTTGLDYRECMNIMNDIKALNQEGVTVLMVCHDMELVQDFAQQVIVMAGGQVLAAGATHEIFRKGDELKAANILPPQMTQLAMRLGGEFFDLDYAEDFVRVLAERRDNA